MSISIDLSGDVAGSGSGEVIARTLARAGAAVAGGGRRFHDGLGTQPVHG
jgi:NADP-dependent 3-hydroxy acid dehydrogenase YdfG